jgi:hypothetical protein
VALVVIVTETVEDMLLTVAVVIPPQSYCSEERCQFDKSKILAVVDTVVVLLFVPPAIEDVMAAAAAAAAASS